MCVLGFRVIDKRRIIYNNHPRIFFLRIEPIDLAETLQVIIRSIADLSWIEKMDQKFVRDSLRAKAQPTVNKIVAELNAQTGSNITSQAGEYIVSELARTAIVNSYNYLDIPISELYKQKVSGNPGFDFHTQNDVGCLIFGEAKYRTANGAYGAGLSSIVEFINDRKDIMDIDVLRDFIKEDVLNSASNGTKGFAVAFSSKTIDTDVLVNNITKNSDFKALSVHNEIMLVAVNI